MATIPIEEKHELIRRREELLAYDVAKQVIEKPKASIWIIFMPILFVFHAQRMQKYKKSIHAFARHFMHTKGLALDAAREEAKTGKPPEGYPGDSEQNSGHGRGNAAIRERQLREIAILKEHYLLLLKRPGETYPALLKNAYGSGGHYRFFLNRLFDAEEAVTDAVIESQHATPDPDARDVVMRMKEVTEKLREKEMKDIFG